MAARTMTRRLGPSGQHLSAENVRASLWFWPFVAAVASLVIALLLLGIRPGDAPDWVRVAWPGDEAAALALLQTVAGSTMSATALTFSFTIVALQLSSQQFSPRLLRRFARDGFTQAMLALLVSTFVVALTGLRGIREGEPLPVALLAVVSLLGICSIVGLLAFTGHMVRFLRVETMMAAVHRETVAAIEETYPHPRDPRGHPDGAVGRRTSGTIITSSRSGFLRVVRVRPLVRAAEQLGVRCVLIVRPGDHVTEGTPVAEVWADDGSPAVPTADLTQALRDALELGYERTLEQDVALGFRQLTDIAVKAISPAINDPTTAAHVVGYCADLLVRLEGRRLSGHQLTDGAGRARVLLPDRDLRYYLELVCLPLRHYGRGDAVVLSALLAMLRDAAVSCRDESQRREIARQVDLVEGETSERLLGVDADRVRVVGAQARAALAGDLRSAFLDRAGETRSV